MIAPEQTEEVVDDERSMSRNIMVFLAVMAALLILLCVLILLIVTGSLPIDEETILRTWAKTLPRPFVYW